MEEKIGITIKRGLMVRQFAHAHKRYIASIWMILGILTFILFASGCIFTPKRNPVPQHLSTVADVPGYSNIRFWGDEPSPWIERLYNLSPEEIESDFSGITRRRHAYLALSGGAADGAFGAGALCGWTASGTRPEFTIVTGISTGALLAPFAFLGPDYDALLKKAFTEMSTEDIVKKHGIVAAFLGKGLYSTAPLKALITKYFNMQFIASIAAEHRKGRRLWIGTTHLDAGRPVVWNIGEIAESGTPGAEDLIRRVILASASVPGVFPPIKIEVEAEGKHYDEIHVDGGTVNQAFVYPLGINIDRIQEKLMLRGGSNLFVIRNSKIKPQWNPVKLQILQLINRAISELIRTQGLGDIYRIYLGAQRDGIRFHLIDIPNDFDLKPRELFDRVYMNRLFDRGFQMAKNGIPWKNVPPGIQSP